MNRRRSAGDKKLGAVRNPRQSSSGSKKRSGSHVSPEAALLLLTAARVVGAAVNIIHDCDEVYNYWEPLHYLMYGYGMQTWEYSAAFALRSWWYILLHAAIGAPAARLLGDGAGKVAVFYIIKGALALLSALTEWWLYKAVRKRYSETLSTSLLAMLCMSSGMFAAASALLPSSFTMYALTAAAAAVLESQAGFVILSSVIGVIWGWCVAGIAYVPYALWVLVGAPQTLVRSIWQLVGALIITLGPLVLADNHYYGSWKASLWNFIQYNVAGGGKSALYGVEAPTYYLRNGVNQLQLILLLALSLPLLAFVGWMVAAVARRRNTLKTVAGATGKRIDSTLYIAISPFFLWLAAISALPHKEERFLYVVYPLICLAAAASLDLLYRGMRSILGGGPAGRTLAGLGVGAALVVAASLSISRSTALIVGYGAPMQIYRSLPSNTPSGQEMNVCVGAEWYRYPSSFFLPGPQYRLRFIKSGFNGLLPRAFNPDEGGTKAAPLQFNDENREEPGNYWSDSIKCDFAVTMGSAKESGVASDDWLDASVLGPSDDWKVLAEQKFLDNAASPALTRAFYVPGVSSARNRWQRYVLLQRQR